MNTSELTSLTSNIMNSDIFPKVMSSNKIIPKAPFSNNTYNDFIKILKAYLKELKEMNLKNAKFSENDLLVIYDLILESQEYSLILIDEFFKEGNDIISFMEKIISVYFLVYKNFLVDNEMNIEYLGLLDSLNTNDINNVKLNTDSLITFPFFLKYSCLEIKLQYYIEHIISIKTSGYFDHNNTSNQSSGNFTTTINNLISSSESLLDEIITLQNKLKLEQFECNVVYYYSLISFIKSNYKECSNALEKNLEILEGSLNKEINMVHTNSIQYKIIKTLDFLSMVYELQKE